MNTSYKPNQWLWSLSAFSGQSTGKSVRWKFRPSTNISQNCFELTWLSDRLSYASTIDGKLELHGFRTSEPYLLRTWTGNWELTAVSCVLTKLSQLATRNEYQHASQRCEINSEGALLFLCTFRTFLWIVIVKVIIHKSGGVMFIWSSIWYLGWFMPWSLAV